jgi:hypothetical protein
VLLALIVKRQGQSSRLEADWAVYVLLDIGNGRLQQSMCEPTQGSRGGQLFADLPHVSVLRIAAGDSFATKLCSSARPQHRLGAGPVAVLVKKYFYVP